MPNSTLKTVLILCDGMSDRGADTPMSLAKKPAIDALCKSSLTGLCRTIKSGVAPGSDTANLAVLGYDPEVFYTGRSPIEALAMNVGLNSNDVSYRCNLVTLEGNGRFEDLIMADYSGGEITSAESAELIKTLSQSIGGMDFYAGVSYRNLTVLKNAQTGTVLVPPHDILGKPVGKYLPSGLYGGRFTEIIKTSYNIFSSHPVNAKRISNGLRAANAVWFWGEGKAISLPPFSQKYNATGAVISAVDLIKGIGIASGMKVIEVEGATGTLNTNYEGKARAAIEALSSCDFAFIHIEAPDECSHQGDKNGKIRAIENIDSRVLPIVLEGLKQYPHYRILILPDHATPVELRTHTDDPVPFMIYDNKTSYCGAKTFDEKHALDGGVFFEDAGLLLKNLFH